MERDLGAKIGSVFDSELPELLDESTMKNN